MMRYRCPLISGIARPLLRRVAAGLALSLLLAAGGCQGAAALIAVISGPDVIPARFVLPDKTTVVMVDDPQHFFDNPSLGRQIGTTAVHYMQLNEALIESTFIEPREVARLERRLARDWAATPIDDIGRELGADQVIYAKVINVSAEIEGTLYRPSATLEVKVISSSDGTRLWPRPGPLADPDGPPTPGHRFTVEMSYQAREGPAGSRGTPSDLLRRLADEMGQELAQNFYDWTLPEPGETL